MPTEVIALVAVPTPRGEMEALVTAQHDGIGRQSRELEVRVSAGLDQQFRLKGSAPDDYTTRISCRRSHDSWALAIQTAVTLDPYTACVLACVGAKVIDAVTDCIKNSSGVNDLLRCLKSKGVDLGGGIVQCILSCSLTGGVAPTP